MAKDANSGLKNVQGEQFEKQPWHKMELSYLGDAADLIQIGTGKLSATGGDPGEHRKQRGGGNS